MRKQNFLIRKLKFKVLIFAVTALTMPFAAQAQDAMITLPTGKLTSQQVFDAISAQTPYGLTINRSRIGNGLTVNVKRSPVAVSEVLGRMFSGTGFTWSMDGNIIFLPVTAVEAETLGGAQVAVAAIRTLTGTVRNTSGETIEDVAVEVLGADGAKTVTNNFGRFTIEGVASGNYVVRLTSGDNIRFREVAVPATGSADVTLVMSEEVLAVAKTVVQTAPTPQAVKTTAYFVPNAQDNTIRAFTGSPKTSMSLVPEADIRTSEYMPKAAIKTNLLYLATTTLNIGAEFGLAKKWTLDITAGLNPWDLNSRDGGIRHWLIQPEVRYWFCQRFEKHFIGLHGIGGKYQIMDIDLAPFGNDLTGKRYDGYGIGGGVSYGYHLPMSKRWSWEFTVGVGYIWLDYDKYNCGECDNFVKNQKKHYFGPTKAGISLIFMIK